MVSVMQRARIDPESRIPLEDLLDAYPGGIMAIPDLSVRRNLDELLAREAAADARVGVSVARDDLQAPGPQGCADITLRIYRPHGSGRSRLPCIYFIHGGGMIMGSLETEDHIAAMLSEELGVLVASVDYRLAPEHPYPAQVDDCYAGLEWLVQRAESLGIDAARLALYGASAGGGLAVACAMKARNLGGPEISLLMCIYPMLDDRNETQSSREFTDIGIWDREANLEAWGLYLGGASVDQYAAPTTADDLSRLPATFLDVGEVDLFRDEDVAFAARLMQSGVRTELHVYPGAYHASEVIAPEAALSQRIWGARFAALTAALLEGNDTHASR
jgi:acetyl esterase/lipase